MSSQLQRALPAEECDRDRESHRGTEDRFRVLVQHATDGVTVLAQDGTVIYQSESVQHVLGYEPATLTGRNVFELIHPDDISTVTETFSQIIAHPELRPKVTYRFLHSDGAMRWMESYGCNLLHDPAIAGIVVTTRDITERRAAEASILSLASIVSSMTDAITGADLEDHINSWNAGAEQLYGYSADEVMGRRLREFVPDDRVQELEDVRARVMSGESSVHHETVRRHKDGSLVDVAMTISLIRDATGRIVGTSAISHDISARKQFEQRQALLTSISDALAQSLDVEATLRQIARMTVPSFADWCTVNLFDDTGVLQRLVVAHANPAKADLADSLMLHPLDVNAGSGTPFAATSGKPVLHAEIAAEALDDPARPEYSRVQRELGMTSSLSVPLVARGTVIGAVGFIYGDSGRAFAESDIAYAKEIARRAATAIDNARLYQFSRTAEAEYRAIIDQMPAVMYRGPLGDSSVAPYLSPRIERLLGYTVDEWLSSRELRRAALHPDDRECAEDHFARRDSTLDSSETEYRYITRGGDTVWVHNVAHVVRDEGGKPLYWQGFLTNVTKRKLAEEKRRQSEERFRAVFEHAPIGIVMLNPDGEVATTNAAFQRMVGYSENELRAMSFLDLIPDDERDLTDERFWSLVAGEIDHYALEKRYIRKDGQIMWASLAISAVRDDDGRFLHSVSMIEDVTEARYAEEALRQSEHRYRSLVQNATDVTTIISADGVFVYASPSIEGILGYVAEDLIGSNCIEYAHPNDVAVVSNAICRMVDDPVHQALESFRFRHANGSWRWLESTGRNLLADPAVAGIVVNSRDVTERRAAEEAIRDSEERFRRAFDDASIGMAVVDHDIRLTSVNPALCRMLGYDEAELVGKSGSDISHPDDVALITPHAERGFAGKQQSFQIEKRYQHKDGTTIWCLLSSAAVHDQNGEVMYFLSQFQDITERKELEIQLSHQALHDSLTGLPNRTLLMDRLDRMTSSSKRHGGMVAVLFLDLDNFKLINDSLGHAVGDEVLVGIAARLQTCVRDEDTIARFGGDEFVIIMSQVEHPLDAIDVADRVLESFRQPLRVRERDVIMSPSIGIALSEDGRYDRVELLRHADIAMYRAKSAGRGNYHLFDADMQGEALQRLELEHDLRRALERDEFQLVFQPVVSLATGEVKGAEALIRWQHPVRGCVPPVEFISVAEETGLIVPIGDWVLREACKQAARLQHATDADGGLRVSVNLSARQFRQANLAERVRAALEEAGLPAHLLMLELTESILMGKADEAVMRLRELRELGVTLAIDDFGTGYSSLSYLHSFPVEVLKIDRSFISRIGGEQDSTPIVSATIRLAQALGMKSIAEGIETREQFAALKAEGCDLAQGYFFSRPVAASEIARVVRGSVTCVA